MNRGIWNNETEGGHGVDRTRNTPAPAGGLSSLPAAKTFFPYNSAVRAADGTGSVISSEGCLCAYEITSTPCWKMLTVVALIQRDGAKVLLIVFGHRVS
jgi:hypothetical protein